MTTWHAENGDWVTTAREVPVCYSCTVGCKLPDEKGIVVATSSSMVIMVIKDAQKLIAECPKCKKTMYREVS